jgi:PAS domain S-box-containing protein
MVALLAVPAEILGREHHGSQRPPGRAESESAKRASAHSERSSQIKRNGVSLYDAGSRPPCLYARDSVSINGRNMRLSSVQAELEAEVGRLRDLLEREKLDSRRGEDQVRFQARLLDAVHEAVIATDPSGIVLYWNRFAAGLYGWTAEEAVGRNILELTPAEEVVGDAQAALARLRRGEPWSGEITLRRRDGTTFCGHVSDAPVYDEAERLVAIVGISYDITERKEAEAKQALLVRELHHRVKNTLTTVQAIMGSTARSTETTEDFQRAFTARIASLARTHSLLTEAKWQSVAFGDLLRAELEPYDDGSEHRITLAGPPVELPSELAVPIGMALHELTTNAAKHGALGELGGRVEVRWSVKNEDACQLCWVWNEHDGPPVELPTHEGFGSRLLKRVLTVQTGADVKIDFDPDGLRVTVALPLGVDRCNR